jgi:Ca2+-binding RTX toxin-like protein
MAIITLSQEFSIIDNPSNKNLLPAGINLADIFGSIGGPSGATPSKKIFFPNEQNKQGEFKIQNQYSDGFNSGVNTLNFQGTGFTYNNIPTSGTQVTLKNQGIASGTVTSFEIVRDANDFKFPGRTNTITTITVTDIAIPVTQLDPLNFKAMMPIVMKGDDTVFGSAGQDIIRAGTGNDTVYGGEGPDVIYGDAGNDLLFGGEDNDILVGGEGNDWLVGGAGVDTLSGGDGDDGIVYDPNDIPLGVTNGAGLLYTGGAGYDTLYVNAADGGNPFAIDLAARGFEQANISRVDTTNQSWASNINVYDAAWRLVKAEYVNDNGTKDIFRLDPTNNQNWNKIQSRYDSTGKLDYEITFFDDGSQKFLDFDLNNEAIWSSRILLTNAAGVITSDTFVADTVLAQRSAENISKKAFVSDALI